MDTEMLLNQMEQDFEEIAKEHEVAASNERLWAKGAPDSETTQMHTENAEELSDFADLLATLLK